MLSRSRAGKELTAPLEESGSDDEYDSDGEGAYGPLGGLAALSVPVVSIGASSAEALLAAMGAGQAVRRHRTALQRPEQTTSAHQPSLVCFAQEQRGRSGKTAPAVVSITYGGEKEWAWQSAHTNLRSAVADGGGSGSGRGGGAVGR